MPNGGANEPAGPGRQALVLLAGVVTGFLVGGAAGAPFDIDVGAGHAVFHLVIALSVGLAALWLLRNGATELPSRFALWSAMALALAQLAEGLAAIADGSGDSTAHEIPNVVSLVVLQPLVLVALCVLAFLALRRRLAKQR
ncbi:MAG: hypothetical protein LC808_29050 [Actinobacteria bacterium]|nr:hypothetical protein [Actinomycetota bacterium]